MSEALRLAELLEKFIKEAALEQDGNTAKTAAELRRLHEANQEKGIRLSERMKELLKVEAQRDELLAALRALMAMDVKGHALADRLQFSDAGRALLHQCQAAIAKAEQEE